MLDFTKNNQTFFSVILKEGLRLDIPMPSAADYDNLMKDLLDLKQVPTAKQAQELVLSILNTNVQGKTMALADISHLRMNDLYAVLNGYAQTITDGLNSPKVKLPTCREYDEKLSYYASTYQSKMVADYANISLFEAEKLPLDIYLFLTREAFIFKMNKTEEGIKYLEKCWIYEQTKPDRDSLRKNFQKE